MANTDIERHQPRTLADDRHYMEHLPGHAAEFARSGMCPAPWKIERSDPADIVEQKIADLTVVGRSLAELDMRINVNVMPQVYVVHGRPGFSAQLQIALAARHGCHIVPLDEESSAERGVVKVLGKDRQWHRVTVTIEEARTAKWPDRNPNYKTMPDRMLMARAVTKAIGFHCPEAKLMLPPGDQAEMDFPDPPAGDDPGHDSAGLETGELVSFAQAGHELLDAYTARGMSRDAARPCARLLWQSHGLTVGDSVPRSRLELIKAVLAQAPAGAAAGETAGGPQDGPGPEHVTPEVVAGNDAEQPLLYGPDEEPFD